MPRTSADPVAGGSEGADTMLVIGHRGAGSLEPENTVRSFVRAEREGVDELELDLRLTKDGRIVVLHDATLDRTTSGAGPVVERTWSELCGLDAGDGEPIPLFDDVLQATTLPIQTEIKAPEVLGPLLTMVQRYSLHQRIYVTSQSVDLLRAVRRADPAMVLGLVMSHPDEDSRGRCRTAGASVACPRLTELTPAVARSLVDDGIRVLPWSVNTAEAYDTVAGLGVFGFATDRPDLVGAWRARAGRSTEP